MKSSPAMNDHSRSDLPGESQETPIPPAICEVCERTSASPVSSLPLACRRVTAVPASCVLCGETSTVALIVTSSVADQSTPALNIVTALPLSPNWPRLPAGVCPCRVRLAPALTDQSSPTSKLELSMAVQTVGRGLASVRCVEL